MADQPWTVIGSESQDEFAPPEKGLKTISGGAFPFFQVGHLISGAACKKLRWHLSFLPFAFSLLSFCDDTDNLRIQIFSNE
jgi:hypothetical protein